jgi:hypothetical protein
MKTQTVEEERENKRREMKGQLEVQEYLTHQHVAFPS